jgi:hypothetical protein
VSLREPQIRFLFCPLFCMVWRKSSDGERRRQVREFGLKLLLSRNGLGVGGHLENITHLYLAVVFRKIFKFMIGSAIAWPVGHWLLTAELLFPLLNIILSLPHSHLSLLQEVGREHIITFSVCKLGFRL